jgi:hypothetical protein
VLKDPFLTPDMRKDPFVTVGVRKACPDDITGAASDATWAADRAESIKDAKVTTGLYFDPDGSAHDDQRP